MAGQDVTRLEEQVRNLERQVREARQAERRAQRDLKALTARLENLRDDQSVRVRWGMLATEMIKTFDGWLEKMPTAADALDFGERERVMAESVVKRLKALIERIEAITLIVHEADRAENSGRKEANLV